MSPYDRLKENIPAGGKWFWYQNDMIEAHEQEGGVRLAWQKKNEAYAYGLYPGATQTEVMESILSNPPDKRWALEWIPADTRCKGFVDVDIKGEPDTHHKQLADIVQWIREKFRREFSSDLVLEIHVCCGSRYTSEGEYKNSYHIVINNLIFENNHDGTMQNFFDINLESLKLSIDAAVYSRNRLFRLPHNSKQGGTNPLYRISGDPTLDQFNHRFGESIEAVLPFFVSDPEPNPCAFLVPSVVRGPARAPASKPEAQAKDGRASKRQKGVDYLAPPCPFSVFKRMLEEIGDNQSVPTGSTYIEHEQKWQIQCNANKQRRPCVVSSETFHDTNNLILFVTRHQGGLKMEAFCTAESCKHKRKPIVGYAHFDMTAVDWCITLSPQFAISAAPEEPEQQMEIDAPQPGPVDDPCVEDEQGNPETLVRSDQRQIIDVDNPDLNKYQDVKALFELDCFKIREPFSYGRVETGVLSTYMHTPFRQYFTDWTFWGPDATGKLVKKPFIDEWLRDRNKRTVRKIVVDPTGGSDDVYNMWSGFAAARLSPVPEDHEDELIAPIIKHVDDVITGGNAAHTKWVLDYMANMIQRPERKSQVAISLYGAQGCGKGIIFEFLRQKVLGEECSFQTSKPEIDLIGRFANGALNRVCIQVDEVKSLHEYADRLKDLITNQTINYEQKGRDTMVVSNLSNIILTSNNANALTVSADDRRYVLFHCSSVYKGDPAYFNALGSHLDRPEVARAFYQHCLKRDLSPYPKSFQFTRPITDYYREAQRSSIPVLSRFLSAFVNQGVAEALQARQLYQRYETFRDAGNYKFTITASTFAKELKKVQGIERKHTKTGTVYELTPELIKKHLEDLNEHDPDAEF